MSHRDARYRFQVISPPTPTKQPHSNPAHTPIPTPKTQNTQTTPDSNNPQSLHIEQTQSLTSRPTNKQQTHTSNNQHSQRVKETQSLPSLPTTKHQITTKTNRQQTLALPTTIPTTTITAPSAAKQPTPPALPTTPAAQ